MFKLLIQMHSRQTFPVTLQSCYDHYAQLGSHISEITQKINKLETYYKPNILYIFFVWKDFIAKDQQLGQVIKFFKPGEDNILNKYIKYEGDNISVFK